MEGGELEYFAKLMKISNIVLWITLSEAQTLTNGFVFSYGVSTTSS